MKPAALRGRRVRHRSDRVTVDDGCRPGHLDALDVAPRRHHVGAVHEGRIDLAQTTFVSAALTSSSRVSADAATPSPLEQRLERPRTAPTGRRARRASRAGRGRRGRTSPGLPTGATSSSVFVENTTGSPVSPSSLTVWIVGSAADAKTSAGETSTICSASAALPP